MISTQRETGARPLTLGILLLMLAAVTTGVVVVRWKITNNILAWFFFMLLVTLPFSQNLLTGWSPVDLFSPAYMVSLTFLIHWGLPSALTILAQIVVPAETYIPNDPLAPALVWAGLGIVVFYVGYYLWKPKSSSLHISPPVEESAWPTVGIVFFVLVMCATGLYFDRYFALVVRPSLSGWSSVEGFGYLLSLSALPIPAFHLACLNLLRPHKSGQIAWFLILTSGLLAFRVAVQLGARSGILWAIGIPFVMWHYTRHRLTRRSLVILGAIALLFSFIFATWRSGRGIGLLDSIDSESVIEAIGQIDFSEIGTFYVSQTADVQLFAEVVDHFPSEYGYLYFGPLTADLLLWIPRAIWPARPVLLSSILLWRLHPELARLNLTAFGVSWLSELYVSFGILGLTVGMFLTGKLWRQIYKMVSPISSYRRVYAYAASCMLLYVLLTRSGQNTMAALVVWVMPVLVVDALLTRKRRSDPHHSSRKATIKKFPRNPSDERQRNR